MKKEEKLLFKELCNFKSNKFDERLLNAATPSVLGHLFFNRMQAIAYDTLKKQGLLGKVNREFRNSLCVAYKQNLIKNNSFLWCVQHLTDILKKCTCKYSMLKGAFLCDYYPDGYRTSNDIDLLVMPENVTEVGNILLEAGFKQGNVYNEVFVEATRREIIESKMMRGETVPYIKEVNLPGMKYLEVDINFSIDYKNGDTTVLKNILNRSTVREINGIKIHTLDEYDFFIHLCSHLHKEASTLPWVEMKRDMTLYKYCDIYVLLSDMTKKDINTIFKRAVELDLEKICAFTILQTAAFFDVCNKYAIEISTNILNTDPSFIHLVVSPKDKKTYMYTEKDIFKRFFYENRNKLLREVDIL